MSDPKREKPQPLNQGSSREPVTIEAAANAPDGAKASDPSKALKPPPQPLPDDAARGAGLPPKIAPNQAAPTQPATPGDVAARSSGKVSSLPVIVALLGGAGLALLGGLYLQMADTSVRDMAALRDDMAGTLGKGDVRLKAVEAGLRAAADSQARALAALERRLAEAETKLAGIGSAPASSAPAADVAPPGNGGDLLAGLEAKFGNRINTLDGRLASVETALAAPKAVTQVAQAKIEPPRAAPDLAAQLVIAQSLSAALDRAQPFAVEIAALKNLGIDDAKLTALSGMADRGAPQGAALLAAFRQVIPAVLAAGAPVAADQTWIDRIGASAAALVRVRRSGAVAGDDAASIVAGMEAALTRNDFSGFVAGAEKLPAPARAPVAALVAQAQARAAADAAARTLVADAIAGLGNRK